MLFEQNAHFFVLSKYLCGDFAEQGQTFFDGSALECACVLETNGNKKFVRNLSILFY